MMINHDDLVVLLTATLSTAFFGAFFCYITTRVPFGKNHAIHLRTITQSSTLGFWIDFQDAIYSLIASLSYVLQSYTEDYVMVFYGVDVAVSIFFLFNYILQLYTATDPKEFVLSGMAIVDVVTVVPVLITVFLGVYRNSVGFFRVYRLLKVARVFRLMRLLRTTKFAKTTSRMDDALTSQIIDTCTKFICMIFICAGLIQAMDGYTEGAQGGGWASSGTPLEFHDAMYFTMITLSTVGYGDYSPPDIWGKLFVILLVCVFLYFVPTESTRIAELVSMKSKYEGKLAKHLRGRQIVIGCNPGCVGLFTNFLLELFHEDHGLVNESAVALVPSEPDMEWQAVLLAYKAGDRMTYLKGDLRNPNDMDRVGVDSAKAVFIIADRNSLDTKKEDTNTLMRVLCVQDYVAANDKNDLKIYVQVIHKETMERMMSIGLPLNHIVCIEEIKTRMLANACLWHGWSQLLSNMIGSVSLTHDQQNADTAEEIREHFSGLGKEFYLFNVGEAFAGTDFHAAALTVFRSHAAILMGVITEDTGEVLLYPGDDYIIRANDRAFLIADDASVTEQILDNIKEDAEKQVSAAFTLKDQSVGDPEELRTTQRDTVSTSLIRPKFEHDVDNFEPEAPPPPLKIKSACPTPKTMQHPPEQLLDKGERAVAALLMDAESDQEESTDYVVTRQGTPARRFSMPAQSIKGHIILLAEELDTSLPFFVEFIYAEHIVETMGHRDIKIICQRYPESAKIRTFLRENRIELIHGELNMDSLTLASVRDASVVVLFGRKPSDEDLKSCDADALAILLEFFTTVGSSVRFVVELYDADFSDQVALMDSRSKEIGNHNMVLTRSMFRMPSIVQQKLTLTAQNSAFMSSSDISPIPSRSNSEVDPAIIRVDSPKNKAKIAKHYKKKENKLFKNLKLRFCSGDVVLTNFSEILMSQAFFNDYAIPLVSGLLSKTEYKGNLTCANQIKIPKHFFTIGQFKIFGELFKYLLDTYDALSLGLFRHRRVYDENGNEETRQGQGMVITSPSHGFPLREDDLVYVLCSPANLKHIGSKTSTSSPRRKSLMISFEDCSEVDDNTESCNDESRSDFGAPDKSDGISLQQLYAKQKNIEAKLSSLSGRFDKIEGLIKDLSVTVQRKNRFHIK